MLICFVHNIRSNLLCICLLSSFAKAFSFSSATNSVAGNLMSWSSIVRRYCARHNFAAHACGYLLYKMHRPCLANIKYGLLLERLIRVQTPDESDGHRYSLSFVLSATRPGAHTYPECNSSLHSSASAESDETSPPTPDSSHAER
jgi:hypothetical protein